MKYALIGWLLLLAAFDALAHPGIGLVRDARGNLYYTDLEHVWQQTPDGRRRIVVRNVHTHELYLDAQGNLYGEHTWYEGEATNRWGYYVWRRSSSGQFHKVIPNTAGFRTTYSFVRDQTETMYWVERGTPCRFMLKRQGRPAHLLASGTFRDIRWLHATRTGTLYFVDDDDLYRLSPQGIITRMASNLDGVSTTGPVNHNLQGIWSDKLGNVYVAVANQRLVRRLSPTGRLSTVATSPLPWAPSGGLVSPDGTLWLLEYSSRNEVRIRAVR